MAEFNEAASRYRQKILLIWLGFVGLIIVACMYVGLITFKSDLSADMLIGVASFLGMAAQAFISNIKDASAYVFGSSQSSQDKTDVVATMAEGVRKTASAADKRATIAAVEAGVPVQPAGTTTTTTVTETPAVPAAAAPVEKLAEAVADNTAATKVNTDAIRTTTEETKP